MGFRDGRAGFAYAVMLTVYEGMIAIFAYEQMLSPPRDGGRRRGPRRVPWRIDNSDAGAPSLDHPLEGRPAGGEPRGVEARQIAPHARA